MIPRLMWGSVLGGVAVAAEHTLTIDWLEWLKVTASFGIVLAAAKMLFEPFFDRLIFNAWKRRRADVREALDEMYTTELRKLINDGVAHMGEAIVRLSDLVDRLDARSEHTSTMTTRVVGQVEMLLRERGLPVAPYEGPEQRDPESGGGRRATDKINPIPAILAEASVHD